VVQMAEDDHGHRIWSNFCHGLQNSVQYVLRGRGVGPESAMNVEGGMLLVNVDDIKSSIRISRTLRMAMAKINLDSNWVAFSSPDGKGYRNLKSGQCQSERPVRPNLEVDVFSDVSFQTFQMVVDSSLSTPQIFSLLSQELRDSAIALWEICRKTLQAEEINFFSLNWPILTIIFEKLSQVLKK
jgi:hypothetical protein